MEIKLKSLRLENFKGVRDFILQAHGENCVIKGINGAGKTSIMDAFLWLLFDKDSRGNAQFSIKTLDAKGEALHDLEHSVEGVLNIDGEDLVLKKVYKEIWRTKRGSRKSEFSGHTTDYYIDEVPVQKKEWDKRISEIIDEETFKLLTSPTSFNSLRWQKRREILLDVCGDISMTEVIDSNNELSGLVTILNGHKVDEQKAIITGKKKKINDRLKEIPARIDELDKSLADVSGYDKQAIEGRISELNKEIRAIQDNAEVANLRKKKAELQANLAEFNMNQAGTHNRNVMVYNEKKGDLETEINKKKASLKEIDERIWELKARITKNETKMVRLREDFENIDKMKAPFPDKPPDRSEITNKCYACGQDLPEEQVHESFDKALAKYNKDVAEFNQQQAEKLAEINAEGKKLKTENEEKAETIKGMEKTLKETGVEIQNLEKELSEVHEPVKPEDTQLIKDAKAQIKDVEEAIEFKTENLPDTGILEAQKKAEQTKLAEIEAAKKTKDRVKELGAEEKKLAEEYEELERQTYLIEQFIVSKVNLLEEKINSKFELARFRLFNILVNGGVEETCVTTYNGVSYGDALNTGAEINVGLDIIKTLSEHYGIKAPVFIDHAESISEILDPGMQTIKLFQDENFKELEVVSE